MVKVTERYAHLAPEMYNDPDYEAVNVDVNEPRGYKSRLGKRGSCARERLVAWFEGTVLHIRYSGLAGLEILSERL
jgi:hypothetical protein